MEEKIKKIKIGVWFLNGTRQDENVMRVFPNVSEYSENSDEIRIKFDGNNYAVIQKKNVLFVEIMYED